MVLKKLTREQLTVGEYEKLIYPKLIRYLTNNNKPTEQYYLRDEDGFVVEVTVFEGESKKKQDKKIENLKQISRKTNMIRALGL